MKILDALRRRSSESAASTDSTAETSSGGGSPIGGQDRQSVGDIGDSLSGLSQVELAEVEEHERANRARPEVLHKLRYMRGPEPVEGYDAMEPAQIKAMLADANGQTVRAVRDYERKFRNRPDVRAEAARLLPSSAACAEEQGAKDEKAERVRASGRRS